MNVKTLTSQARQWWRKDIRPLLILAVVLFAVRSSLADWNDVPTGSMKPTIQEGDRIFVNKLAYDLKVPFTTWHMAEWRNPKRGDIVVFYSPHDGKRLVKRVVGLPGDVIELRNNSLILNGKPVEYERIDDHFLLDASLPDGMIQNFAREKLADHPHVVAGLPSVQALRDFGPRHVPE